MENSEIIRLAAFASVLLPCTLWEYLAPKKPFTQPRLPRWFDNLSLMVLSGLLTRLVLPLMAMDAAVLAQKRGWGLLQQADWPMPAKMLVSFFLLDLLIYFQHVASHKVPVFWRLHRVHHSDLDLDATSGVRFHPVEILLSMLLKIGAVLLIGAPAQAVLAFEIVLNATALFNHSDIRMPGRLDGALRLLVVTPDMHRVHHSVDPLETNSNYGFNMPWWDRLFGTYRAQPQLGHDAMALGLPQYPASLRQSLLWLLALPFAGR